MNEEKESQGKRLKPDEDLAESIYTPCRDAIQDGLDGKLNCYFDVTLFAGKFRYDRAGQIFRVARSVGEKVEGYVLKEGLIPAEELDKWLSPENILKLGL